MIFRQLFELASSTYTYLIGCEQTGQAVLCRRAALSGQTSLT